MCPTSSNNQQLFKIKYLLSCRSGVRIPPETPYKDKKATLMAFNFTIIILLLNIYTKEIYFYKINTYKNNTWIGRSYDIATHHP